MFELLAEPGARSHVLTRRMTLTIKPTDATKRGPGDKKPYERPRLDVYGDIREIAKSIGKSGMADGAAHGNTKTQ